jgi:predicted nucleic acid-binding protein
MQYSKIYFLDASAMVKLVLEEIGSQALIVFFDKNESFYTTSLCFGEALGVLKSKRFHKKRISQEVYISTTYKLCSFIKDRRILIEGESKNKNEEPPARHPGSLLEPAIFFKAADTSDKYQLDLSDALQLVMVRESNVVGATLITADEQLAAAARAEGLEAWDCVREDPPNPNLAG